MNSGLELLITVLLEILKGSDQACLDFMESLMDEDEAEPIMEIMFDCTNSHARSSIIRLVRYLVCRLKEIEKDGIFANEFNVTSETVIDSLGQRSTRQVREPQTLSLRFFTLLKCYMPTRAARNWK